ncbi:MAG: prefoldin subunit beta [Candidatus Altiarchaeota archaeon]
MDVPKNIQDKLAQFQGIQNQLHVIGVNKQQLILQNAEVDNATEELAKSGKGRIYKAAGSLLIETTKADSDKYLAETKETVSARIQILEKQEKKLTEKFNDIRGEIESMVGKARGGSAPKGG